MKLIKLFGLFPLIPAIVMWSNSASAQCATITTNPTNVNVCTGITSNFSVVVTGSSNNFQWQQNDGSGWVNITTPPYTNFNTATLSVVGSPAGFDGFQYRCVVSKAGCPTVTSNPATLTLKFGPLQVTPPVDAVTCLGKNASFEVGATGDNLVYQWMTKQGASWVSLSNNTTFSGVTTNKLVITNPAIGLNGSEYFASISGTCPPTITSDTVMLTINTLPQITAQPSAFSTCLNKQVTFATAATGTTVAYQWQEDAGTGFVDLPGAPPYAGVYSNQLDILAIGVTPALNGRKYRCVVSGACEPADTTIPVTLTVLAPPNVSLMTNIDTLCEGEDIEVTTVASGAGLIYFWEVDKNDGAGFIDLTDGGAYSGTSTATMKITSAPAGFNGFAYRCRITGTCPPVPTVPTDTLYVIQDKSVGNHPMDTAVHLGVDGEFRIGVIGTNLSFHWQVDDGNGYQSINPTSPYYSGINSQLLKVLKPGIDKSGYMYRCLVYGGCDEVPAASNGGMLTVLWPASANRISLNNNIQVYPNPVVGDVMSIKFGNIQDANVDIRILDKYGKILVDETFAIHNGQTSINVNSLPSGMYFVHVSSQQFSIVENIKFTKL